MNAADLAMYTSDLARLEQQIAGWRKRIRRVSKIAAAGDRDARRQLIGLNGTIQRAKNEQSYIRVLISRLSLQEAKGDTPMPEMATPREGWVLKSTRNLRAGGTLYPPGAPIPVDTFQGWRNGAALLASGAVVWSPPGQATAQPKELPPPEAVPPKPDKIEIIADDDPVRSWRRSLDAATAAWHGDESRARDSLLATEQGSKLYRSAVKVDAANRARENPQLAYRRPARAL